MKIRRFLVLAICLVALTLSLLPVSFAYNQSVGSVNSPFSEPMPVFTSSSDFTFYMVGYFTDGRGYELGEFHITGLSSSDKFCVKNGFIRSSVNCSIQINVYDISTGSLLNQLYSVYMTELSSPVDTYYYWSYGSIFAQINGNTGGLYYILPDSSFINVLGSDYSPAFVSWSERPIEHNIYHSQLSEPVADKYNRYFVLDDKLFWVSIRVNGFWLKSADIEGSTGYYQYEALAPQQGGYEYGYQGVLAQYSGYVPVNLNYSGFFNSLPFDIVLLPASDRWSIGVKSSSIFSDVQSKIDCEFFISVFNLVDGEYLSSSFFSFQRDNLSSASFPLSESGSFSDVRCYGVNFYNSDNIPVNLSDVLWEYDLEFVLWRDDMLHRLTDIYNLLSEAESLTSYQAPDLASKMDDENIINDLSYNSCDVQQDLNVNIDRGIQALGSDGGVLQSLSSQIISLGNGKIFSLLIISLSLGVLILILGKNKND